MNKVDNWKRTPLHTASLAGRIETIKALLSCAKIDVTILSIYDRTALELAKKNRKQEIQLAFSKRDEMLRSGSTCNSTEPVN